MDQNVLIEEWVSTRSSLDGWGRFFLINLRGYHYVIHCLLQSFHVRTWRYPSGDKLALILFAVLVNKLTSNWNLRAKYVDDQKIVEIIQRYSFSMLPTIAKEICTFSAEHGMRLNGPKCKVMLIDFVRYKPFPTTPIFINGLPIEQVSTHKILGV